MHHVVADEWSAGSCSASSSTLYEAFRDGAEPLLAGLPVQYADFAVWQRQWLSGEVLEGQSGYWRGRWPARRCWSCRPTGRARRCGPPRARSLEFAVPPEIAERLRAVARDGGRVDVHDAVRAFTVLLARYCGQDDVVVGTPIANRNRAEIEA